MPSQFPGFPPEALTFFRGLSRHNNREWFQARKPLFEAQVKQPMRELVMALNAGLRRLAPEYATEPDQAIYRIYRDTRFSADKTPYKDHIAAFFRRRSVVGDAGYFVAISHKEVAIGAGVHMPEPAELLALRHHIAQHHAAFRELLAARGPRRLMGELQGEQLTRGPKGFAADHPAADLLRFKSFTLYVKLPPELATTPALLQEVWRRFRASKPFVDFLSEPATAKRPPDPGELLR